MSNPTTLQELADSLAASARSAEARGASRVGIAAGYQAGYAHALLDTRATVLAMIADINRRIAANNQVVMGSHQSLLDGRIEAYEDVRGGDEVNNASPAVVARANEALARNEQDGPCGESTETVD